MMKTYQVVRREDGCWAVVKAGAMRAASVHDTQEQAIAAAEALLTTHPGYNLVVEGGDASVVREPSAVVEPAVGSGKVLSEFARLFGLRLQRGRMMRGYSLRGLADALGGAFSHTQLQKFEKGMAEADTRFLALVSRVLDLRADYFMRDPGLHLQAVEYRSLTKVGVKDRERLKEEAFEFFERYLEIESILGLEQPKWSILKVTGANPGEEVEHAAAKIRTDWNLGLNPIPNVHSMLENNGVKVKRFDNAPEGFDGLSAFAEADGVKIPTLALARKADLPRQRLTALHELAHLVLEFPEDMETREKERLCHRFSASMLLPPLLLRKLFGNRRTAISVGELKAVKEEWGISCAAVVKSIHNAGMMSDGAYKAFCIESRQLGWHKKEPGEWKGSEESSRFKQLVHRALAQELISSSKAAGLLKQSVDEIRSEAVLGESMG